MVVDRKDDNVCKPDEGSNLADSGFSGAQRLRELSALAGIVGIGNGTLAQIASSTEEQIPSIVSGALRRIALLAGGGTEAAYIKPLAGVLSADQYILPLPLEPIHSAVVAELNLPVPSTLREDAGLLLDGRPGSGKSEYVQFLASLTEEHVEFVCVNASTIRAASNPPLVLEGIYADLEERARRQGRRFVLVLDEFDQLITANAEVFRSKRTSSSQSASDQKFATSSTEEVVSDLKIDAIGSGLLNTLKSILGSNDNSHVFTIATTNVTDLPEAIYRGGRLRRVTVDSLAGLDKLGERVAFLNDWYRDCVPRILNIMDATHFRKHRSHNSVLIQLRDEIVALFQGEKDWLSIYLDRRSNRSKEAPRSIIKQERLGFLEENGFITADENSRPRAIIFEKLFGYPISEVIYKFRFFGSGLELRFSKNYQEIDAIVGATPSSIRQSYLATESEYSTLDGARRALGFLLFPQVLRYNRGDN